MDPEEARARAASRKASRMASRDRGEEEAAVVSVEELSQYLLYYKDSQKGPVSWARLDWSNLCTFRLC